MFSIMTVIVVKELLSANIVGKRDKDVITAGTRGSTEVILMFVEIPVNGKAVTNRGELGLYTEPSIRSKPPPKPFSVDTAVSKSVVSFGIVTTLVSSMVGTWRGDGVVGKQTGGNGGAGGAGGVDLRCLSNRIVSKTRNSIAKLHLYFFQQ